ncbi:ecto-NOX disulfide-thiol exchanger 2 [Trichonephila inaurata madagascariensis]|uniref:Ecto-NOX disulfide-thiol exchanger 2 n=1 Tax=Trichonephila inaurata madagascariensis TaxID=2747483 RepID=A0A8X7BZA8_9ARAC|nr:ecto-NOX disulfide-thiol exchanger 2 [Trichonephila inaurata madagascariensis]
MDSPPDSYMHLNQGNYTMMSSFTQNPAHWVLSDKNVPDTNLNVSPTPEVKSETNTFLTPYINMTNDPNINSCYPLHYYHPQVAIGSNFSLPITLSNAVLTPPAAGSKANYSPKPDGCHTVFVGGLPEKITASIITEVFEKIGEINSVRMHSKKFCHVRFTDEESVEQALLLSGYEIKIENKDEPAYKGKLIVNYAVCRKDQRNFECRQRQERRFWRHYEKAHCPPPLPCFSEHEAASVNEKLRSAETFKEAVQLLITWLEKGQCVKGKTGTFYGILQNVNNHVSRLASEKSKCEEEVKKARENFYELTRRIQLELSEIKKVYAAAEIQKNWDLFSKTQRRHIENWKKEAISFSTALLTARVEEDMDLDLDEDRSCSEKVKQKVSYADNYTQCEVGTIENETHVIALIAIFLLVHPYGIPTDTIRSHVVKIQPNLSLIKIENVMKKFPNIFQEELTEVYETKWRLVGYNPLFFR